MRIRTTCLCREYRAMPDTAEKIHARCAVTEQILKTCDELTRLKGNWTWIAQCRVCGSLWTVEHIRPEQLGGGPACAYMIDVPRHARPDKLQGLLREAEDLAWFGALGPECGPEICGCRNCERLRIHNSKYCAVHHFRRIKGYRVPGT